jgi:hypothetical protein
MRGLTVALFTALTVVGCSALGSLSSPSPSPIPTPTSTPSPSPSLPPSPTPSPSPTPKPTPSSTIGSSFYLRAWYTQALAPRYTFSWLPMLTIVDGKAIDGNVAIPMIYPGPLMVLPVERWITDAGTGAILDEARRLGLLTGSGDFTGGHPMAGGRLAQLELIVDGQRYDLTGDPSLVVNCTDGRCDAEPGTPEAFAAFWQELGNLDAWLGDELGQSSQYKPERLAILLTAAAADEPPLTPLPMTWPLDTPLDRVGVPFPGEAGARCLTVTGDDLAVLLPMLQSANQLSTFVDAAGNKRAPVVAVLVPGEDSPCPDGG